jgi:hypothetical protein
MTKHPTIMQLVLRPRVVRSSIIIAIIVGTILNVINQGDALMGPPPVVIWKLVLTYLVPYCVSTYGAVMALRNSD